MYHMRAIISLHCKTIPVMKTGFSLCGNTTQGNPVLALYWPCTGPVKDCGVVLYIFTPFFNAVYIVEQFIKSVPINLVVKTVLY